MVSRDEGAQRFGINLRIHVRNQFEHEVIDARQPGGGTRPEAGQFTAVTPRQMPAGHLDLLLNQVEIIEQPLGGVGSAPRLVHRLRRAVVGSQYLFIFTQPCEQLVGTPLRNDRVVFGQGPGMVDQLFKAEYLRAQRRFIGGGARLHILSHSSEQSFQPDLFPGHSIHNEMATFRSCCVQQGT